MNHWQCAQKKKKTMKENAKSWNRFRDTFTRTTNDSWRMTTTKSMHRIFVEDVICFFLALQVAHAIHSFIIFCWMTKSKMWNEFAMRCFQRTNVFNLLKLFQLLLSREKKTILFLREKKSPVYLYLLNNIWNEFAWIWCDTLFLNFLALKYFC